MGDKRQVIWLTGFPSSGNLKAQLAIANLLAGRVTSIEDLDTKVRIITEDLVLPPDPLGRRQECVFTHLMPLPYLHRLYDTIKIVYVLRNPIDAGISSAGFLLPYYLDYRTVGDEALAEKRRELIDFYMTHGTTSLYLYWGYGSWPTHVMAWATFAQSRNLPMHRLGFEAMRERPEATMAALARFLEVDADGDRIADVIDNVSMPVSRAMEDDAIRDKRLSRYYESHMEPAYARGWRYHGSGKSGYGKDHLTEAQWARARAVFGPVADHVGYQI